MFPCPKHEQSRSRQFSQVSSKRAAVAAARAISSAQPLHSQQLVFCLVSFTLLLLKHFAGSGEDALLSRPRALVEQFLAAGCRPGNIQTRTFSVAVQESSCFLLSALLLLFISCNTAVLEISSSSPSCIYALYIYLLNSPAVTS